MYNTSRYHYFRGTWLPPLSRYLERWRQQVKIYEITWNHIPEDSNLLTHVFWSCFLSAIGQPKLSCIYVHLFYLQEPFNLQYPCLCYRVMVQE